MTLSRLLLSQQLLEGIASWLNPDWEPASPNLWDTLDEHDQPRPGMQFGGGGVGGIFAVQDSTFAVQLSTDEDTPPVQWIPSAGGGPGVVAIANRQRYQRYLIIGHCQFIILTALAGGWAAKRAFAPRPESA